jgi:hypothetical protein
MNTFNDRWKVQTQFYTVRANRGKPRIWLEGKRLTFAGFECGGRFEMGIDYIAGKEALVLMATPEGSRKVSGKNHRAIIDICGDSCKPFKTGDVVKIDYTNDGLITIKAAQK